MTSADEEDAQSADDVDAAAVAVDDDDDDEVSQPGSPVARQTPPRNVDVDTKHEVLPVRQQTAARPTKPTVTDGTDLTGLGPGSGLVEPTPTDGREMIEVRAVEPTMSEGRDLSGPTPAKVTTTDSRKLSWPKLETTTIDSRELTGPGPEPRPVQSTTTDGRDSASPDLVDVLASCSPHGEDGRRRETADDWRPTVGVSPPPLPSPPRVTAGANTENHDETTATGSTADLVITDVAKYVSSPH